MFRPIYAAALGIALASGPALAGDEPGKTTNVSYDDLDLTTEKGQKKLEARLNKAAREVCNADATRTGTRVRSPEMKQCLAEAKASSKATLAKILAEKQLGG